MNQPQPSPSPASSPTTGSLAARGAGIIIVTGVMFSFISYWRTAAIVLCDLASTSYYIGAIVELSIGPAAPWFILAVMGFSYAVRWVYIESCTLFVRGGVYRVVREAMGPLMAKIAVSALLFDYVLTGPISSVTAGQYILGLAIDLVNLVAPAGEKLLDPDSPSVKLLKNWGSVVLASLVTVYFFRQNLKGIHESSQKALRIMQVTTVMGALLIGWCLLTLVVKGPAQGLPSPAPHLQPRVNNTVDPPRVVNPMGFLEDTRLARELSGEPVLKLDASGKEVQATTPDGNLEYRMSPAFSWFSIIGVLGVFIAFGHSILAMSGEETLAQVYREVESPKLPNFRKAALIVFLYSLVLTAGVSFLAVILIPDKERLSIYPGNLLGGLAMNVWGPDIVKILLQAFVVVVGFLILSGAVNTAIIGSNGVLNRVAEDGVVPDWFLKPHPRYGTTHRILWVILGLKLATILASRGDVFILGEAYAFGVVWSFVFQALSMVVLRFRRPQAREFKVPLNIPIGKYEVPVGLGLVLVILLVSAVMNFLTKELATIFGVIFTTVFFILFTVAERTNRKHRAGAKHEHLEQFNQQTANEVSGRSLGLNRPYLKLVSIRSPQNLFMLEKALAETDPETTAMVVMTAKYIPPEGGTPGLDGAELDVYDQQLMTAVVDRAEKAGKQVSPLIVPTNNPLHAILKTAKDLKAHELILGASNKYSADEQFEQIAFYWISLHDGEPAPLTVRVLSRERDMYLDLSGGSRIPRMVERNARTVAELRAAGEGVDRVLLLHDGSPVCSDLFRNVLTMLADEVVLGLVPVTPVGGEPAAVSLVTKDQERARQVDRPLLIHTLSPADGPAVVDLARNEQYDVIVLPLPAEAPGNPLGHLDERGQYIVRHAHCRVFLATTPGIPQEVVDRTPSANP